MLKRVLTTSRRGKRQNSNLEKNRDRHTRGKTTMGIDKKTTEGMIIMPQPLL